VKSYEWVVMLAKRDGLSVNARWLATLLYHYAGDKGWTNASHEQLAAESGLGKQRVRAAVKELLEAGIIKRYQPGRKAGFGHPAMASSFTVGWPNKGIATDPLGSPQTCLAGPGRYPSKGSTTEGAPAGPLERKEEARPPAVVLETWSRARLQTLIAASGLKDREDNLTERWRDTLDIIRKARRVDYPVIVEEMVAKYGQSPIREIERAVRAAYGIAS
jgi:hypothetical protein